MASLKRSVFQWTFFVVLCLFGAGSRAHDSGASHALETCEKALVGTAAPDLSSVETQHRQQLLNSPEEWIGGLNVGLVVRQQHFEDLSGSVEFDERIFLTFEFSKWFKMRQVGELIIERVGSQWYTHVNLNKTVTEGQGLGTFMYLASAYFLKKYLNIEPISAPNPPAAQPRKAPATALWARLVRWGFAGVVDSSIEGKTFHFRLENLKGTNLEKFIEGLVRKPSDFENRLQRFKDGQQNFLQ